MTILPIVTLWPPFEEGIASGAAAVAGPFFIAATDVYQSGAAEAEVYVAGAAVSEVYVSGSDEGETG